MGMKKYKVLALFLAACVGFSALTACSGGNAQSNAASGGKAADTKKDISVATSAAVVSLDPIHASDGFSVALLGNVVGGLYSVDAKGALQLELAKDVQESGDGLTYTFTLRDAAWSNGTPVTAKDFVYAWRRLADPNSGTEYAYLLAEASIKNAEAVSAGKMKPEELGVSAKDDKTLVVQLERPCPYFKSMLAFTPFSPLNQEFVEKQGKDFAMTAKNMIYCGAYAVTAWDVSGNTVTMTKNDKYWDAAKVDVDEVNFKVVPDAQQGAMSYENGDLDRITLTGDLVSQYKTSQEYSTELGNFNWYLYFNDKSIDNVKLRQAIAYSIDRENLVNNVLKDGSVAQYNLLMTGLFTNSSGEDFNKACGPHYKTDKEKAKQLWAEAQKETPKRSMTLTYEADSDFIANAAAFIQSEIETTLSGFKVELQSVPKKTRIDNMKNGKYDVALHRWGPDYADASCIMSLYTTDSPYNYAKWSNAKYDELIQKAGTTDALDPEARWNTLKEAESVVMDSAVNVPIFQTANSVLTRSDVHNITNHLTGVSCYYKYVTVD